jgi:uncharacterized membrane protein/mono/diheme cytochrome c family protein
MTAITFIAHFHPVLVHLPIGMLLAALLLQALAMKERYAALRPAVPVVLLAGVVFAVLSCLTGWLLSLSGDYDPDLVSWHMWMALSLTALSVFIYFRLVRKGFDRIHTLLSLGLLVLLLITGHLGGSLTHGADYLSGPLTGGADADAPGVAVDTPIANVQEAMAYQQVIRPIFQNNCYNCHGRTRQKGGLRVDGMEALIKGGKDGSVIVSHHADSSLLIRRLLLPADDEHHMPPRDRRQLNERQLTLLRWWVDEGPDYTHKIKELPQPDSIRPALLALQRPAHRPIAFPDIPTAPVEPADAKAIAALTARGVLVMPVAQNSNWLEADLSAWTSGGPSLIPLLSPIKKQLVSLRAPGTPLADSDLTTLGQCLELRSLDLAGTKITDRGLPALRPLKNLHVLNLVGTAITAVGVTNLQPLQKLRSLYLFRTQVTSADWPLIRKTFPSMTLDSGGYSMPVLASDTQVVKAPPPAR